MNDSSDLNVKEFIPDPLSDTIVETLVTSDKDLL